MSHNNAVGQYGERLASKFLISRGYEIKARNVKTSYKEIDIIADLEGLLIVVEVKTRTSGKYGMADEMITVKKINNLKQAALQYMEMVKMRYKDIRIDFVSVDINLINKIAKIKHYKNII